MVGFKVDLPIYLQENLIYRDRRSICEVIKSKIVQESTVFMSIKTKLTSIVAGSFILHSVMLYDFVRL